MNEMNSAYTVNLVGKHLMEAGAGTGKTYNIVTLFLRMVLGGIPVKKILVVTYTNPATAELVNRLHKGLEEMKAALQSDDGGKVAEQCKPFLDNKQWKIIFSPQSFPDGYGWDETTLPQEEGRKKMLRLVNQALLDFDQAPVSTIHGFCQSVLNENVFESGIQFGLKIRSSFSDVQYKAATDFCRKLSYDSSCLNFFDWLDIELTPADLLKETQKVLEFSADAVDWKSAKQHDCKNDLTNEAADTVPQSSTSQPELNCEQLNTVFIDKQSSLEAGFDEKRQPLEGVSAWEDILYNCDDVSVDLFNTYQRVLSFHQATRAFLESAEYSFDWLSKLNREKYLNKIEYPFFEKLFDAETRKSISSQQFFKLTFFLKKNDDNSSTINEIYPNLNIKKRLKKEALQNVKKILASEEATKVFDKISELNELMPDDSLLKKSKDKVIKQNIKDALREKAAKAITEAVEAYKRDEEEMSFNDLLTQVRDILRKESNSTCHPLTDRIREQYDAVLVDEFQDTDEIQYSIFEWVFAGNWHEPGEKPRQGEGAKPSASFFMIGDPKQAIYAFRGGDLVTYQSATDGDVRDRRLSLTTNHRSSDAYIDEMNILFRKVMPVSSFSKTLQWTDIGKQEPGKAPHFGWIDSHNQFQDLTKNLLTCNNSFDGNGPAAGTSLEQLVEEIGLILDKGFYQRFLKKANGEEKQVAKPIDASDIAVLVNSNAEGVEVQKALVKAGIPCQWFGDISIFSTEEAAVLLLLMDCLLELGNSRLVLKTLCTPLFGCTAKQLDELRKDSLAQIQTSLGDIAQLWLNKSFLTAFDKLIHSSMAKLAGRPDGGDDSLAMVIRRGADGERVLAHYFQLAEALNSVAIERHLGRQGLFSFLKRKVATSQKNNTWGTQEQKPDMVQDDDNQNDEERFNLRLSSENPAVQVMTAHKSKGLQFPIVFAYNILCRNVKSNAGGIYHRNGKRRYYLESLKDNGTTDDPATMALYEQYDEMRRLFYVVVTRARYLCRFIDKKTNMDSIKMYDLLAAEQEKHPLLFMSNLEFSADIPQKESQVGGEVGEFEALDFSKINPAPGWSTISFTTLSPAHREYLGAKDLELDSSVAPLCNDEEGEEENDDGEPDAEKAVAPIFQMPMGKAAGTCWHSMFENLDFQWDENLGECRNGQTFENWLGTQLSSQFRGTDEQKAAQLKACIDVVQGILCNPMPIGFSLKEVQAAERCAELHFTFQLKNGFIAGNIDKLKLGDNILTQENEESKWLQDSVLQALWQEKLDFPKDWAKSYRAASGHNLTGSIDLLFEHQGKTYILDWKTNSLKNDFRNFSPDNLRDAMLNSYYPFQYLLYTVAWMRFYDSITPGHEWNEDDYLKCFGGCIYIFCRGVSQDAKGAGGEWPRGFHFASPSDKQGLLRWEVIGKLYKWLDVAADK